MLCVFMAHFFPPQCMEHGVHGVTVTHYGVYRTFSSVPILVFICPLSGRWLRSSFVKHLNVVLACLSLAMWDTIHLTGNMLIIWAQFPSGKPETQVELCVMRKKPIIGSMRHLISQLMCLAAISSISVFWNHPLTALRHNYHPSHTRGWKKRIIVLQFESVLSVNNLIMVVAYGPIALWWAFKLRKSNTLALSSGVYFSPALHRKEGWTSSRISLIISCPFFFFHTEFQNMHHHHRRRHHRGRSVPDLPTADAAYASQYSSTVPSHQSQALANYPNQLEPARGMSFN